METYDKPGNEYNLKEVRASEKAGSANFADDERVTSGAKNQKQLGKGFTGAANNNSLNPKDLSAAEGQGGGTSLNFTGKIKATGKNVKKIRRRLAGGGIMTSLLILGGIWIGGITTTQLGHLDALFGKDDASQEDASDNRIHGLFRVLRTGDIGESRLTALQSKVNSRVTARLAEKGIKITTTLTGQAGSFKLDLSKNPDYADRYNSARSDAERLRVMQSAYTDNNATPPRDLRAGNVVSIDMTQNTISAKRNAIKIAIKQLGYGKIRTAIASRILTTKLNAPSMFHPFKRLGAYADSKVEGLVKWRAEKKQLITAETPEKTARFKAARDKFKATSAPRVLGTGVAIAAGACLVKEIAEETSQISYENVYEPSMRAARVTRSMWSQQQSGIDYDSEQVQAANDQLVNNNPKSPEYGTSVFDSVAIKARMGEGPGLTGVDAQQGFKDAFNSSSGANQITEIIDSIGGEAICSPIGVIAQVAVGGALLVLTVGSANVASTAIQAGFATVAIAGLVSFLPSLFADQPIVESFEEYGYGAFGGTAMDFGSVASSDLVYAYNAGVAQSPAQTAQTNARLATKDREEFQSKNLASRLFDTSDYRSLIGRVIDKQDPSSTRTLGTIAKGVTSIGNTTSKNVASVLTSSASAYDVQPYDYGFPRYGFSDADLNNPNVQDPIKNAEAAVPLIPAYKDEAKRCFGVNLEKDSDGKWGAATASDVNLNLIGTEYNSDDCIKAGDLNWLRIRLFIFDTKTMEAYACYEGIDEQSCTNLGAGEYVPAQATPDTNTGGSGTLTDGFPLKTTKEVMKQNNGKCFDDNTKEMCISGHPYTAYDIMSPSDVPVVSLLAGTVQSVGFDKCNGRLVSISSPDKDVTISYLHMSVANTKVALGDTVAAGQEIGIVGTLKEGCTAPHLHIDVATGASRPGCKREDCPAANQAKFIAGNDKIMLGKSLYENYNKLP